MLGKMKTVIKVFALIVILGSTTNGQQTTEVEVAAEQRQDDSLAGSFLSGKLQD
jgi:hypothetical protein